MSLYKALIRFRLEYGEFLLHNILQDFSAKLDKIKMKALRIVMGYRNSTPLNVILTESREPSLFYRLKYLGLNYFTRVCMDQNHPLRKRIKNMKTQFEIRPLHNLSTPFLKIYKAFTPFKSYAPLRHLPDCFSDRFKATFFSPEVDIISGYNIAAAENSNLTFNKTFDFELNSTKCIYTDGLKSPNANHRLCNC